MSIHEESALRVVNRYSLYSAAAGLIPMPVFDMAAVTAIQLKMLKDLADLYRIRYQEDLGKGVVSALLGGIVSSKLAWGAAGSFIKGLPVVGQILGIFVSPAFASASTYAVGKVFIQHFESGGTFLDLDPDKVREHFNREYTEYQSSRSTGLGSNAAATSPVTNSPV